ncbi:MAG: translational GTPase TypA [Chloroflexi bacterium]|jgi:GTP-binding protein|nr:translational GTPase TypA [Chloroflexota bacterium]MBT4002977.1 translational GTPase TypA [Chloroflexota bacterium]MBT4305821.1 translational GTPase TypA [Chloroflexota bacterium]MBT4533645.1 translational GTPase TypA [Chloroflexota bacterium]MBT4681712.1 translational GTPase TypA [Chloroflexota bacterium]
MLKSREDIRNIAIIAHVDHGKTTLVDGLLRQAQVFRVNQQVEERVMDSNDLERERGITILAKNTAIQIKNPETNEMVKVNIVDTPGHADFGGEVERVLNMVDGVLLLVDAAEGPRPQTRFVLKKALEMGHRTIVVINKVDRKDADPERVLNETFDLFIELGATDEQADFTVVYAIATTQQAGFTPEVESDLQPLFQTILKEIPAPQVDVDGSLQMLVTTLAYDNYRGLIAVGRIFSGTMKVGQPVAKINLKGEITTEVIRYLYLQDGLNRVEVEEVAAGDIVAVAGIESISIGETLTDPENPVALPSISVEEPTVQMAFGVNTSPFTGKEGRWATSRKIRERLFQELKSNVSLRVQDTESADTFIVSGRGELHLAILIETMRREGYEFQVSRPQVIYKTGTDGKKEEPFEEVHIETSKDTVGPIVEMLGKRRGEMTNMSESTSGGIILTFIVPSRGILGFRHHFLTATRGLGIMNSIFHGYQKMAGAIASRSRGSLVAWEPGATTTFGLKNAEERGILFLKPGVDVYAGMVVGEHQRPGDLDVNVCKAKHLTNMRKSVRDIEVRLSPPREMSLDEAIEYLSDDELLEVTPDNLRLRKRLLDSKDRGRQTKRERVRQ